MTINSPEMARVWANAGKAFRDCNMQLQQLFGPTVVPIRAEPVGTAYSFAPKYVAGRENPCPCCGHRAWWIEAKQARCGSCDTVLDIVRPLAGALNGAGCLAVQMDDPHRPAFGSAQTVARIALLSLRARARLATRERFPQ